MRNRILAGAALAVLGAAACKNERAITTEPVGAIGFGQNLIKTSTNLPRGRVNFTTSPLPLATAAADTIVINFAGLDSLSTASYQVWVANDSATKFAKATGTLSWTRTDTTINVTTGDPVITTATGTINNVSAFKNGGQNVRFRYSILRSDLAAAGWTATDSSNVVLFSIEPSTPGTSPSDMRILWARRSEAASNLKGLKFGNFAPRTNEQFVFDSSSTALIPTVAAHPIIPRGRVEVRGSIFTVTDSNYYRPPRGYYYEAFAVAQDTLGKNTDTISLGRKASPYPNRISFYDADRSIPDPQYMFASTAACATPATGCPINQPVIFAAQHRVNGDTIPAASAQPCKTDEANCPRVWRHFSLVYVTLQNKFGIPGQMGGAAIMNVTLPGSISGF